MKYKPDWAKERENMLWTIDLGWTEIIIGHPQNRDLLLDKVEMVSISKGPD